MENNLSLFDRVFTPKTKAYKDFVKKLENTSPEQWFKNGERVFSDKEKKYMAIYEFRNKAKIDHSVNTHPYSINELIGKNFQEKFANITTKYAVEVLTNYDEDKILQFVDNKRNTMVILENSADKHNLLFDLWAKEFQNRTDLSSGLNSRQIEERMFYHYHKYEMEENKLGIESTPFIEIEERKEDILNKDSGLNAQKSTSEKQEQYNDVSDRFSLEDLIVRYLELGQRSVQSNIDEYGLKPLSVEEEFELENLQKKINRAEKSEIVGKITFLDSGEVIEYSSSVSYLSSLEKELNSNIGGFKYETLIKNPQILKYVDDLIYGASGEENPNNLESYIEKSKTFRNDSSNEIDINFYLDQQEKKIFKLVNNTLTDDIFYLLPADYDYNGLTDDLEEDDFRFIFSKAGIENLWWDFHFYRSGYAKRVNEGGKINVLGIKIFHQSRDLLLDSTRKLSDGTFSKDKSFQEAQRKIESLRTVENYLKFIQKYNELKKDDLSQNAFNKSSFENFHKEVNEYTIENNISFEKYLDLIVKESPDIESLSYLSVLEKVNDLKNSSIEQIFNDISDASLQKQTYDAKTISEKIKNLYKDRNYELLADNFSAAKEIEHKIIDLEEQLKNFNNQNPQIMETQKEFDQVQYLKDQMKYLGFGEDEKLHKDLEKGIDSKKQQFEVKTTSDKTLPQNKVDFTLKFNKSEQGGIFLNEYNAKLKNKNGDEISHNFYVSKENTFTAKEAVNLLEGRSVKIEFHNPKSDQQETAFVQFNFDEPKTEKGNYMFQNFYEKYGVDTSEIIEKSKLIFDKPEWKESTVKSLEKGNIVKVKFEMDDNVIEGKAVLNPQNRNLKLYDNDMNRLNSNKPLEGLEQDNKHDKANVREQSIKR